jgi:hypothetical protein
MVYVTGDAEAGLEIAKNVGAGANSTNNGAIQ